MTVMVVSRVPRENGMVEVTLAQGATRFTVHVPAIIADSDEAEVIFQHMANTVVRDSDTLRSIVSGPGMG